MDGQDVSQLCWLDSVAACSDCVAKCCKSVLKRLINTASSKSSQTAWIPQTGAKLPKKDILRSMQKVAA